MSYCKHPLKALDFGINPETGKHNIKVIKGEYDPNQQTVDGVKIIPLPCGRCIGCRLKYSRDWADRCMAEASYHKDNMFLTLTYDDDHLPEPLPGSEIHPLVKKDVQKFMKDLRERLYPKKVRFFAAGEYGSKNMRPHYHLLIFGFTPEDIKLHHKDLKNGWLYFTSDFISSIWRNGFHIITDLTWETCAYTARYILKKQKGVNSSIYDDYNFPPEFTLMSRKPGIGAQYFYDHPDIVLKDHYIPTKDGKRILKSNRYYDKLFDIEYHDDLEWIKDDRVRIAEMNTHLRQNLTSLSYADQLRSEEINLEARTKILKRKEI